MLGMEYDFYVYLCALSKVFSYRCAVGTKLLELFGDVRRIFESSRNELLEVFRGGEQYADEILDPRLLDWARSEVDWAAGNGIDLLAVTDSRYPYRLKECEDAPLMLYYKGTADLNSKRTLGVVGTRRASFYGRDACRRILESLSDLDKPPVIVSGLALGIDGTAHLASLDNNLETVAVIPTGMDEIYPVRHRELASRIAEKGAIVTDFPRLTAPVAAHFIRRNRVIAGMSDAVLLCESYVPGGGLITARLANSYDREVFAVPGRLADKSFEGCNKLIGQNVARIVENVGTVAATMGWTSGKRSKKDPSLFDCQPDEAGNRVLTILREKSPLSLEDLAQLSGMPVRELSATMLELEMSSLVTVEKGKYIIR